ncbi:MAG: outer membrane lipoprotein-sorting protein [Deltaproteobacteria bacterium]|nr:outer membrane lipoprotein-sorting protein [Deltaproteobacteria bacterium]
MKTRFRTLGARAALGLAATLLAAPTTATAIEPTETDAAKIMAAVEGRDSGDKMVARMQMTIRDSAGRERVRVVQSRSMKVPGGRKQLMIFESPADVRNTALLTMDYDDGGKDDDQWLYLPSLHKSTRISSADKSGAFMGSDFSYADMTKKDPKDYEYKVSKPSAPVGGEDCWLIEARPKSEKEKRETGYVKSLVWVSKSKLLPLQSKIWVAEGKKIKLLKSDKIKQIDGIWVPHRMAVRTVRGKEVESTTVLDFLSVKLNDGSVKASDFTQRRLEQGL